jgi:hypothetical protein
VEAIPITPLATGVHRAGPPASNPNSEGAMIGSAPKAKSGWAWIRMAMKRIAASCVRRSGDGRDG